MLRILLCFMWDMITLTILLLVKEELIQKKVCVCLKRDVDYDDEATRKA